MNFKTVKLTDMYDNKPIYITLDKILTIKTSTLASGGTTITLAGTLIVTVKESLQIVIAVLEDRDTFAARILYDKHDKSK